MATHDLTIGILSNGDPKDVRTWSGVPFFMTSELANHFKEVVYLPAPYPDNYETYRKLDVVSRRLLGRGYLPWSTLKISRHFARHIHAALERQPVDVILTITVDHQLAFLETDIPIVHHSDTTFAAIEGYYPFFDKLWGSARRAGHQICQQAIQKATACVYPSHWAANSAINDYGADPAKIHIVPYGANLASPPTRDEVMNSNRQQRCQLLFIGVEWARKGGNQAYQTLQGLLERGVDAHLVVIGCEPPADVDRTHVTVHPFLNKQDPEQLALYQSLWLQSSFLCMPSRAETFGAVFAEAAAYGVPVITAKTGGIPDAVIHEETGVLLPVDASGEEFTRLVHKIWTTPGRYREMVEAARDRFENTLNWTAWADAVSPIIAAAADRSSVASS